MVKAIQKQGNKVKSARHNKINHSTPSNQCKYFQLHASHLFLFLGIGFGQIFSTQHNEAIAFGFTEGIFVGFFLGGHGATAIVRAAIAFERVVLT